jgi:hypothetical protein
MGDENKAKPSKVDMRVGVGEAESDSVDTSAERIWLQASQA